MNLGTDHTLGQMEREGVLEGGRKGGLEYWIFSRWSKNRVLLKSIILLVSSLLILVKILKIFILQFVRGRIFLIRREMTNREKKF